MTRYLFAVIFGLGGAAILISLCLWQVQRLAWKEALIADIEAMASAEAGPLPAVPEALTDRYRPVAVTGSFGPEFLYVLTSSPSSGPGFRVIAPFETATGRWILVDRGFIVQAARDDPLAMGPMTVTGNLDWPRESDGFTPAPDPETHIWFARDVEAMAATLGTDPVLVVASAPTGDPSPSPWPVSVNLRNNHLEYAITWGLMAVVWLAMSAYLVIRIRRNTA